MKSKGSIKNINKNVAAPLGEPAYGSQGELATLRAEADAATILYLSLLIDKGKDYFEQKESQTYLSSSAYNRRRDFKTMAIERQT